MKNIISILLLSIFIISCEQADKSKITKQPLVASTHQVKSENGYYIVQWGLEEDKIPYNEYFSITFTIKEPLKAINYSVDIDVNAGMREHNHGMHTLPIIKRINKQQFIAEGMLFHMRGKWQIEVGITRGITRDTATIEVNL